MDPYLVLLRVGFTLPLLLPIARCALTAPFHPYLIQYKAVYFLWHWPSTHAAQPLTGTLPVGARTFLDIIRYRNCLANSHNIPYWIPGQKTMSGAMSLKMDSHLRRNWTTTGGLPLRSRWGSYFTVIRPSSCGVYGLWAARYSATTSARSGPKS